MTEAIKGPTRGISLDLNFDWAEISCNRITGIAYYYEITPEPSEDEKPVSPETYLTQKQKRLTKERQKENRNRIKPWEKEKVFR